MGRLSADPSTPPGSHLWQPDRRHQRRNGQSTTKQNGRQVSITLSEDCLCRLLQGHLLHVEDFTCCDRDSGDSVRRLLLKVISA